MHKLITADLVTNTIGIKRIKFENNHGKAEKIAVGFESDLSVFFQFFFF